jgi:uncharacterized protein (TIGR02598 family)
MNNMRLQGRRRSGPESGFGLLEVLVAVAIFAIGIIAVFSFLPFALGKLNQANQRTVSTELAETKLSQVRVSTAQALLERQFMFPGRAVESVSDVYGLYTGWQTTVSPMRGSDSTYLQRVTFSVTLPDGTEEVYVTYVAKQ